MTYTDEDSLAYTDYITTFKADIQSKTSAKSNWITFMGNPTVGTPTIIGTIRTMLQMIFESDWYQNSSWNKFWEATKILGAAMLETTNPNKIEWDYEWSTDKDTEGYKIIPNSWVHYFQSFWNGIMDTMHLVNLKLALPSGWSLSPADIDFNNVTPHQVFTRIRYRDIGNALGNGTDWSDWIDLESDSGLHKWNLRNKIWVPLRTGKDWTFWDIKFKNSENWWYEASVGTYYLGTDEYWLTHGYPNGRAYYLIRDLIGTDLVPLWIVLLVVKTFKSVNLGSVASVIFKQMGKRKIKNLQHSVDDIIKTLGKDAIDPKAFKSVSDLLDSIKDVKSTRRYG